MRGFVEDGFTLKGYVKADEGDEGREPLWDGVEFTYRPASRLELVKFDAETRDILKNEERDKTCAVKAETAACDFVAKHLATWSVESSRGPVAISKDACACLHPELFRSIYRIIRGSQGSDNLPNTQETPPSDAEQTGN